MASKVAIFCAGIGTTFAIISIGVWRRRFGRAVGPEEPTCSRSRKF
jgi:hypothetical protein